MIKRILIVGDSYTFGHGCKDRVYYFDEKTNQFVGDITPMYQQIPSEYCWGSLLKKALPDVEIHNLAKPGHSNQGMVRDIFNFYSNKAPRSSDLIIFNGSFHSRMEIASVGDFEKTISWTIGWEYMNPTSLNHEKKFPGYSEAKKGMIKHLINDDIAYHNAIMAIFAAYAFAEGNKIKYLWNYPEYAYPHHIKKIVNSIGKNKFFHICKYDFEHGIDNGKEITECSEFNRSCYAPDYHINDLGHKIYFEREIMPNINKILYEQ